MPIDESAVGREGVIVARVDPELTADRYGNEGLDVLATPALIGLFERAAMHARAVVDRARFERLVTRKRG